MNSQNLKIEFAEELRGKNAANFWIGVGVVAAVVYLWWKGWFSMFAMESGIVEPPADGLGSSGALAIAIDTFCMIGLIATALFKLCRGLLAGLGERLGYVSSGVLAWSAKEQTEPSMNPPLAVSRELEALRSHERRLREVEAKVAEIIVDIDAEWDDEDDEEETPDDDDDERERLLQSISALNGQVRVLTAENERLRKNADVAAARERAELIAGKNLSDGA